MRIHAVLVVCVLGTVAVAGGQKLSYADNPNNYNCEDEVIEYANAEHRARPMKSSYYYYTPQDQVHSKCFMKYSPPRKCYAPARKDSRFYQVFQSAGEKAYGQGSYGTPGSGPPKSPAIQIYVV